MGSCLESLRTNGAKALMACSIITCLYVLIQSSKLHSLQSFGFVEVNNSTNHSQNIKQNDENKGSVRGFMMKIFKGLSFSSGKRNQSDVSIKSNVGLFNYSGKAGGIKVGILIPAITRKIKKPSLEKLSLTTICLPSVNKTLEAAFTYVIYVGIDKGDYLETVRQKLETLFEKVKTVVTPGGTYTKTVNAIAREAYTDGMDYLVRINDDTSIETKNWTSSGISVLQNYSPPNIGVVGPTCKEGNTGILTHDMVHRTHLEIFDFYYPTYFDNWYTDDWITKVYDTKRSTKMPTWVVKHHLKTHGTRYKVDMKKHAQLQKILNFDKGRLDEYLTKHKK